MTKQECPWTKQNKIIKYEMMRYELIQALDDKTGKRNALNQTTAPSTH